MSNVFLDIFIGNRAEHAKYQAAYEATCSLLAKNAKIYGLPRSPEDLSDEQQQILADLDKSITLEFIPPKPLLAGRLIFELDSSYGLSKTTTNFIALCTGEKGMCKNAPNKKLHYLDCPIHRIVKGFVAQGGDVTRRWNWWGGTPENNLSRFEIGNNNTIQSIYGGKFVVFGKVMESEECWDVLKQLDDVAGPEDGRPTKGVWIGGCGRC